MPLIRATIVSFVSLQLQGAKPSKKLLPIAEEDGTYIHGTIDVVVQTKDGFVLAGDSRGSYGNGQPLPGEYQKVFTVGQRTGCVVAGLIASNTPAGFFVAKDSVAANLQLADADVHRRSTAVRAASLIVNVYGSEVSLLPTSNRDAVAEFSCASVAEDGHPQWATLHLQPRLSIFPLDPLQNHFRPKD